MTDCSFLEDCFLETNALKVTYNSDKFAKKKDVLPHEVSVLLLNVL